MKYSIEPREGYLHATPWEVCEYPAAREAELLREHERTFGRRPRGNETAQNVPCGNFVVARSGQPPELAHHVPSAASAFAVEDDFAVAERQRTASDLFDRLPFWHSN
jgi:hypothetical protein